MSLLKYLEAFKTKVPLTRTGTARYKFSEKDSDELEYEIYFQNFENTSRAYKALLSGDDDDYGEDSDAIKEQLFYVDLEEDSGDDDEGNDEVTDDIQDLQYLVDRASGTDIVFEKNNSTSLANTDGRSGNGGNVVERIERQIEDMEWYISNNRSSVDRMKEGIKTLEKQNERLTVAREGLAGAQRGAKTRQINKNLKSIVSRKENIESYADDIREREDSIKTMKEKLVDATEQVKKKAERAGGGSKKAQEARKAFHAYAGVFGAIEKRFKRFRPYVASFTGAQSEQSDMYARFLGSDSMQKRLNAMSISKGKGYVALNIQDEQFYLFRVDVLEIILKLLKNILAKSESEERREACEMAIAKIEAVIKKLHVKI